MVIYGKVNNPNESGTEIIAGGARFIKPIFQDYEFIDLTEYNIDYSQDLLTRDQVKIDLSANIKFSISNGPELMIIASERLLGKSRKDISEIAKYIIFEVIRLSVISKDIVEIALNWSGGSFLKAIAIELNRELNKIGIVLISVNIEGIKDLSLIHI